MRAGALFRGQVRAAGGRQTLRIRARALRPCTLVDDVVQMSCWADVRGTFVRVFVCSSSSFYLPNNTAVCTFARIQF